VGEQGIDVCIVGSALFQRGRDASEEVELVREAALRGRARHEAAATAPVAVTPPRAPARPASAPT
jgi:hypothetical protein